MRELLPPPLPGADARQWLLVALMHHTKRRELWRLIRHVNHLAFAGEIDDATRLILTGMLEDGLAMKSGTRPR